MIADNALWVRIQILRIVKVADFELQINLRIYMQIADAHIIKAKYFFQFEIKNKL